MNRQRRISAAVAAALGTAFMLAIFTACSTTSPSPSPSAPTSSPPSAAPSSPAASPASPSAKALSAEEQAHQKAQENWKKVVEAARKEQQPAVLYTSATFETIGPWQETFNKLDPKIQVQLVTLRASAAVERLKAEAATKQYASNAMLGGAPTARIAAEQGLGQLIDDLPVLYEPGVKWMAPPLLDKPHETLLFAISGVYIVYNTNLVKDSEAPKTLQQLGDPKWKDKLAILDPRLGGTGQTVLGTLYFSSEPGYGPDLARKVINSSRVLSDSNETMRMVVQGEASIGLATWQMYLPIREGPVRILNPEDRSTFWTGIQAVVVKSAPQLNTTKVFLNWLLGPEGQRLVSAPYATIRPIPDPIVKETQAPSGKAASVITWDVDMTKWKDAVKVFGTWLDEAGK